MITVQESSSTKRQFADTVVIGKDILELLSSAMYVDPLTVYREFVQNAADSIDDAEKTGLYSGKAKPRIDVTIDVASRVIKIRDNGTGIHKNWVLRKLSALGASKKRGKRARGFRGVGRLSALAYCQELVFRTKSNEDDEVTEMTWNCRRLKEILRDAESDSDITKIFHEVISIDTKSTSNYPSHFFEIEMRHVVRNKNDALLNEDAVSGYLSQVGPVPFSTHFKLGMEIQAFLQEHGAGKHYPIFINGKANPIVKPHQHDFEIKKGIRNSKITLETFTIPAINEGTDAVGWIIHHDYLGALPERLKINGIALRAGNIQVGKPDLVQELFPEPRFNSWAIGEVHILGPRLIPNGRRDNFEQNSHFANLLTNLAPKAKGIAKLCRQYSAERNRKKTIQILGKGKNTVDWLLTKSFLASNAGKRLRKSHRKLLSKIVRNNRVTYSELLKTLTDTSAKTSNDKR